MMTPRHFLVCPHVMISALNYIPATHNNVHLIKVSAQAPSRKKGWIRFIFLPPKWSVRTQQWTWEKMYKKEQPFQK